LCWNNRLDSAFMQNSTMSLPNRSHSVAEIPTTNGEQHHRRSELIHSHSTTNNPLLYQKSLSYIKTINDNESNINNDDLFRTDKYNIVSHLFFFHRFAFILKQFLGSKSFNKSTFISFDNKWTFNLSYGFIISCWTRWYLSFTTFI